MPLTTALAEFARARHELWVSIVQAASPVLTPLLKLANRMAALVGLTGRV
jgi:hypothetical protein